jgi:hypothetical protein
MTKHTHMEANQMHTVKMAALALLMTLHTIAGTGEEDYTPHTHEEPIEAIHARREKREGEE